MSEESSSLETPCTECGASNATGATQCWLCGRALAPDSATCEAAAVDKVPQPSASESPFARSPSRQELQSGLTFRLSSLMLTVTLISVCLGVGTMSPGLGITLAIFVTPAFLRTMFAARRRRMVGQPMAIGDKLAAFIGSLAIVLAISVSSSIAFYATCWVGFLGGAAASESAGAGNYDPLAYGLITGMIVGLVMGLVVAVLMIRWLWPFEPKHRATRIQ